MKSFEFWLKNHLNAPDPIEIYRVLVQKMAWCLVGDKPLSEPMPTRFTDAYMRHKGEMGWRNLQKKLQ